jgi:hypothetical protein
MCDPPWPCRDCDRIHSHGSDCAPEDRGRAARLRRERLGTPTLFTEARHLKGDEDASG